jgi:hypothetical protein
VIEILHEQIKGRALTAVHAGHLILGAAQVSKATPMIIIPDFNKPRLPLDPAANTWEEILVRPESQWQYIYFSSVLFL